MKKIFILYDMVLLYFLKDKQIMTTFSKIFKTESIPIQGVSYVIIWNLNIAKKIIYIY
jgi:hypothetical protein